MCFGSTNPKVASGADNHYQSHRSLSYNLRDELYPNRVVQPNEERENDFWANTRFAKDKEDQELSAPVKKTGVKQLRETLQKKKALSVAQYSTL
jgi:hypothetical protein